MSNLGETLWTKHVQPKTLRVTWYSGSCGKNNGIRNFVVKRRRGHPIFEKKQAVKTASPHWCTGTCALSIKECTVSTKCQFFLSAIPFCCGVCGHVDWCRIPCEDKNEESLVEKYSLALSLLKILIVLPNWFLISLKKDLKNGRENRVTSFFSLSRERGSNMFA